jgi:acetyl-CoA C-acetyltransferase
MMAAGMIRIGEVANRIFDGSANRGVAHATGGHLMQHNLVAVLVRRSAECWAVQYVQPAGGRPMSANRVAVVGTGQTKYASTRGDVSLAGLLREAVFRALEDAHMTMADIDAIVVGKAPDFFEGVMVPEYALADAIGAVGKPLLRVHTAGSVGGSTAIVAANHIESGVARRVLTVAWEMQSCSEAMWALSFQIPFQQQLVAGAGGYFAPYIRNYIARSGAPDDIGIQVAVKDRLNALRNPYAHLHEPEITYDSVRESLMLWDPIRYSETCPSSDGAFAMVLGDEATADAAAAEGRQPAWIQGMALRSEPAMAAGVIR